MNQNVILRRRDTADNAGVDSLEQVQINPLSAIRFDAQGKAINESILSSFTYWELPIAAASAAGKDGLTLLLGANGPAGAQSTTGGLKLTTGAANTNMAAAGALANSGLVAPITATNKLRFASRFMLAAITAIVASCGLNQTPADVDPTAAAGEGCTFMFDPDRTISTLAAGAAGNWILAHKVNGADTFTDTGVPVVANQDYDFLITIDENKVATYFINGVQVGQSPALVTANATLGVVVGAKTTEAVAKVSHVRYVRLSRNVG